ncbi:TIGR00730 family Rossman fold protein [Pedobacter sp. HMF7647]|uniref:Cytokinin riboside 5'-monophosphate phosphoribohydrolase n=1 Tax=Hufsiella arboris TaxID=2695275 RepID=A0A7K1Y720_9SPHI|nr:TIGR00730 family Rossman fold protein [Hufsiella arboris]MXV50240.1 TIGR00730 family Rossman fold protein [Hufsiella arboris]
MNSVCIFCGANFNNDPALANAVEKLAGCLADNQITLIYGGGNVGVMGLLADAVLKRNGKVVGVIPQFLVDKEVAHTGLSQLVITQNMHERKKTMADLSDGFIMLPGGFGTLEEFFEVLTWLQLGLHNNPVGILNLNGYYDFLLKQMDVMVENRFLKRNNRELVINETDPETLVAKMSGFVATPDDVWFRDRNLT